MDEPTTRTPTPVVCANCVTVDRDGLGLGWGTDLAGGHDDEELEVIDICLECCAREFGERRA